MFSQDSLLVLVMLAFAIALVVVLTWRERRRAMRTDLTRFRASDARPRPHLELPPDLLARARKTRRPS